MRVLNSLGLLFALVRLTVSWDVTNYVVVKSITTEIVPDYNQTETVQLTGPLTISAVKTSSTVFTDYLPATYNGDGRALVNVTSSEIVLPASVHLPTAVSGSSSPPETTDSIETYYYAKAVVSNPSSCTKTDFTYTDSIGISLPDTLKAQATESSLVELVTTYVSTISTNLGGQAVTTSRCDIYFNAKAVPSVSGDIGLDGELLLTECVDPRPSYCTGNHAAATGTNGCMGQYPPTEVQDGGGASPTGDDSSNDGGDDEEDSASGWRSQRAGMGLVVSFIVVSAIIL